VKQLIHCGVIVPKYEAHGFSIVFKGRTISLDSEQEEMAVAWVKKLGTEYVNDPVFARNFFEDFATCLGVRGVQEDFDFSEIIRFVEADKARKQAMRPEEKKKLAQDRKTIREANKTKYGYATVDGQRIELGNYTTEPASIFMGRGKHPLRGRWKKGIKHHEVTLNLSPDSPAPLGDCKRVWEPECMWVARWDDPLRAREKYIWFSDSSYVKQKREIDKFNKARELERKLTKIREHINNNLGSTDPLRRKIATVWYLIDNLKFRVGDEKDKDEADTVGATTLRPEHISFREDGTVVFRFLGKDSVEWNIQTRLPATVVNNLKEFMALAGSSIFSGVNSSNAKAFLDEVGGDFSPKVFRTYHATDAVARVLSLSRVTRDDPVYIKKHQAAMANLEAAKEANHKRTPPKSWQLGLSRMEGRLKTLKDREKTAKNMQQKQARQERVRELELRIRLRKETKDYNLSTSLKSYIDPRVYKEWSKKVDFDWKNYYSKTLQKKFTWVEDA
jgi:DNA topoisomerase-1